jgi:signal transduction histidine kinase
VEPAGVFGEMAVVDDFPRSATAAAESNVAVYFIPSEALWKAMETIPKLSLCLFREVSGRLREFNRQYVDDVLQSERLALVGRFARSIIHDLKNPLNIIGLAAELAGMENATVESRKKSKERIRKQVQRITDMVNELLEFTRGSQNSIVAVAMDYGTFVQQTLEDLKTELNIKDIFIELESDPPSVQVQIDPPRLSRVFHNLLHNSADVMPQGGKIYMRFRQTDYEVITELEDTGKGIAPEIANKIFKAFVTFGKAHGTGLGLSICQKIIEDHKGKIYTRVEPGRGAIFVFHLPVTK